MSFASLHKWVTYGMAGLGLVALFLGGELTLPSELAIAFGFFASSFVEGPRIHSAGWQRGWNVALLALLVLQILRGALGGAPLALALEFTAALQLSRLCNRRTAAEHQQIAILAFLHLCAATVLSTEIGYGLAFLGFVIVAPWMLALTHLRSEIEGHYPGDRDPARAADVRRVLASKRVIGGSFLAGTAALSLPLFLMTAALFVAFPRVGLGWLSFGRGSATHVAGFGSDVELGQVGLVRTDPTVVLRVVPPASGAAPPARLALRMRGTSFDRYDGRRWSRSGRESSSLPRYDDAYPIVRIPRESDQSWQIVLDHLDEPVLFLPERTVAVEIPPRVQSGVEIGRQVLIAPGLDVRYEDVDALGLRYRARVSSDPRDALRSPLTPEETRLGLQLPEGVERIAELAREWTAGASSDRERAERIERRLRAFDYSLDMQDPGERAPLDAFLFEWRRGHCEYFSTAMAIMLRTLGIPTRNVTGFLGGRWNAFGRYYAITSGDAHSWVEGWIEGEGWQTFDPTPPARGEIGVTEDVLASLDALLDALRTRWEDDVVSYDLRSQRSLATRLARWLRGLGGGGARATTEQAPAAERSPASSAWPRALAIAGVLAALVIGWRAVRRRREAVPRAVPIPEAAREAVALYRELERALAERGVPRPAARTPREHADVLRASGFAAAGAVAEITERYLAARFGGAVIAGEELARMREMVRGIAAGR